MFSRIFAGPVAAIMCSFLLLTNVARAQHPENKYNIVVVGSSTAAGQGINPLDSAWVYRLAHAFKGRAEVKNLAQSGFTTYHLFPDGTTPPANRPWPNKEKNITKAISFMPDAIIINLASNDAAGGYSLEEQQTNYKRIVKEAADRNIPVWVTTTQPRTNIETPRTLLFDMKNWILETYKDKAIDFWEPFATADHKLVPQYSLFDSIHFNIPAHRILFEKAMAKNILDTLRKGPVKLVAISTTQLPGGQTIHWSTAGERFIDSFRIERSSDSANWTLAGRAKATGSTIMKKDYSFTDEIKQISAYYRISAKDSLGRVFVLNGQKFTRLITAYNLQDFTAQLQTGNVSLKWSTASEKLTVRFVLERSADRVNWSVASEIPAKGTSASASQYNYMDENPQPLVTYYRLKMVEVDGGFTYSNEVRVITSQPEHAYTVVVLGSSTAAGQGISPSDSAWAPRLAYWLKDIAVVKNLAKSGLSTYDVNPTGTTPPQNRPAPNQQANITKAISFMPDAIIINLPSNDAAAGYSLEEQQANFRQIIKEATDRYIPVWVTTTQPRTNNLSKPREPLRTMKDWLLETYKDKAINFWEPFAAADNTILPAYDLSDGVHLNISAHRIMYEKVLGKHVLDTLRKGPLNFITASTEQLPAKQAVLWSTAGERFIDSFRIERSSDSLNWSQAGRVKATGSTIVKKDYTFTDDVKQTSAYYRISAKDSLGRVFVLKGQKFVRLTTAYNLKDFTAQLQVDKVLLKWSTTIETNTVRFVVERSTDKSTWSAIMEIAAKGNSTSASQYNHTDNGPLPLVVYYRLKMVDVDGGFTFSDELRVITLITSVPGSPDGSLKVYAYPNPASGSIWLKGLPNGAHHLQVFNVTGRLMYENKQYRASEINVQAWPRGTYFMVAEKGKYRVTFQRM